jgi:hypothetical protein
MRFPGRGRLLYSAVAAVLSGVALLVITLTSGQASGGTVVMSSTLTGQITALPPTGRPKAVLPNSQAAPTDTPTPTDTPPPTGTATPTPTATGPTTATATPTPTPSPTGTPTPTPTTVPATLTLTGPSSVTIGQPVTLTGALTLAGGAALPQPATLTLTRIAPDGTKVAVTIEPTATGGFSVTSTPSAAGAWTYSAFYPGTALISAATGVTHVTVTRLATTLSLATSANAVNYKATVTVTAHLGTTQAGRQVSVYAQTVRAATRTLLKTATVSAKGDLSVSYAPQFSTTFSVVFPGDARYAAKTVTRSVYVWVSVTQSLAGYYASETYQGTLYRIYHHTSTLHDTITVAPNKHGECVKAEIQIFFEGAWIDDLQSGATSCGSLSSSSHVLGTFGLATAAGARYRIRALFLRAASDAVNLSNDSSWRYFRVVT